MGGLDKEGLQEVQEIVKEEFTEFKKWMDERFMTITDCGKNRGTTDTQIALIKQERSSKSLFTAFLFDAAKTGAAVLASLAILGIINR